MAEQAPEQDMSEMTDEQLKEYQKLMGDVEKREQERIEQLAKEMSEKCSHELTHKMSDITKDYNTCFENRMKGMETRYENHAASNISARQVEILRLNKIIRDVSRNIGDHWRTVFPAIMKNFPEDVVKAETVKIERQRPFMQGYKALTTWKELSGEEIQLMPLIEALRGTEVMELVERVLDIMDADRETLLNMGEFKLSEGEEGKKPPAGSSSADPGINDNSLLKISRQLTNDWIKLGTALEVSDEDINEIKESETGYQAAFKMLWTWRENAREAGSDHEAVEHLAAALKKIGKKDLAEMVEGSAPATTA